MVPFVAVQADSDADDLYAVNSGTIVQTAFVVAEVEPLLLLLDDMLLVVL